MQPSLTIVIPAYNEESSLRSFLPQVVAFCAAKGYKLIVVNDGSKDATQQVLLENSALPDVKVVRNKVNRGYGGAIKAGIAEADTKYVITIDADGQHFLEDVEKLYTQIIETDADMIVGKREGSHTSGYYRETGKWIIRRIARMLIPMNIHDINSGMKIYDAALAKKYTRLCPDSMAYSDIIAMVFISQKHLVLETPINIRQRTAGVSTISTRTAFETLREILNIVILFNPMRVFLPLALIFILAGVVWGLPIVLMGRGISVGAMLSILSGIIFFLLGLLAEQFRLVRKENLQ